MAFQSDVKITENTEVLRSIRPLLFRHNWLYMYMYFCDHLFSSKLVGPSLAIIFSRSVRNVSLKVSFICKMLACVDEYENIQQNS